ncbi:MAG: hypothetical protein ABUT39_18605 [Acidobacteriota bacterium]
METRELDRIRFTTMNFGNLQGLRYLVPLGLMMLSFASWPLMVLRMVLLLGAFALMIGAGRYYRRTFGEVEKQPQPPIVSELSYSSIYNHIGPATRLQPTIPVVPRFLLLGFLALAVFVLFQFLFWPPWVVSDSGLVWTGSTATVRTFFTQSIYFLGGALFLGIGWLRGDSPSRSYPFALGILLSGLAVLAPYSVPAAAHGRMALLLCGSSMVLAGLLDHWQIVRTMGHPAGEEE